MTRIVQLLSHSIESYDQLKLYTELGYEAVDIGGYIRPSAPHDPKRPALPEAPYFPELQKAVDDLGTNDNLRFAQEHIPDAFLDWLGDDGLIIMHHYLERMVNDWPRLRDWMRGAPGRRIVWRSVGQSVEHNERFMAPLRAEGLERVAYSPKEANIPGFSGATATIRFYKDPDEWCGWTGEDERVINVTQGLRQREPYCNWAFWHAATEGLNRLPIGEGSEVIGGPGQVTYDEMRGHLRSARCYLYTGTQPASYTLGLIEALMTGIPVVSIGPTWMRIFPFGPDLFEGHELVNAFNEGAALDRWYRGTDDPKEARHILTNLLNEPETAAFVGGLQRQKAIDLFGKATVSAQWKAFLG